MVLRSMQAESSDECFGASGNIINIIEEANCHILANCRRNRTRSAVAGGFSNTISKSSGNVGKTLPNLTTSCKNVLPEW
jgi:hypothetical protein